jgi:DNA primase
LACGPQKGSPMPGISFRQVRTQVSMAAVLELLEFVPVSSCGHQVRGPCPIHRSASKRSRSFSANLRNNAFHCFKCGASGNQLDLYGAVRGLTVFDAAIALCERMHQDIPWIHRW